ncbi:MAG: hypothetical protein LUC93_16270 [Planctomycetaceae bacterium]|nr:hypothetical protein [Planctomycetaceae bacterium]
MIKRYYYWPLRIASISIVMAFAFYMHPMVSATDLRPVVNLHLPPGAEWNGRHKIQYLYEPITEWKNRKIAFKGLTEPSYKLSKEGFIEFQSECKTERDVQLLFHMGPGTTLKLRSLELCSSDDPSWCEKIVEDTVNSIPITEWVPPVSTPIKKDWRYLAGVTSGWGTDPVWRFTEDAGRRVYQAVLPIPSPGSIEIWGDKLPEIVQFSLTARGDKSRRGFLLWHEMNPTYYIHPSGKPAVRLDIYNGLVNKGYDPEYTDILEPILYFKGLGEYNLEQLTRINIEAAPQVMEASKRRRLSTYVDGNDLCVSLENLPRQDSGVIIKGQLDIVAGELLGVSARSPELNSSLSPVRNMGLWSLDSFRISQYSNIQQTRLKAWFSYLRLPNAVEANLGGRLVYDHEPIKGRLWWTYGALFGQDDFKERNIKDCLLRIEVLREGRRLTFSQYLNKAQPERIYDIKAGDLITDAHISITTLSMEGGISELSVPFYLIDVVEVNGGFDYQQYTWIMPTCRTPVLYSPPNSDGHIIYEKGIAHSDIVLDYVMDLPLRLDLTTLPDHMRTDVYVDGKLVRRTSPALIDLATSAEWGSKVQIRLSTKKPGIYKFHPPVIHGLNQMTPKDIFTSVPGWETEIDRLREEITKEDISGRNIWLSRVTDDARNIENPPLTLSYAHSFKECFIVPDLNWSIEKPFHNDYLPSEKRYLKRILAASLRISILLVTFIGICALIRLIKIPNEVSNRIEHAHGYVKNFTDQFSRHRILRRLFFSLFLLGLAGIVLLGLMRLGMLTRTMTMVTAIIMVAILMLVRYENK